MNVFSNFTFNKLVLFNGKDPPWISEYLKTDSNNITKYLTDCLNKNNKNVDYNTFQNAINNVSLNST